MIFSKKFGDLFELFSKETTFTDENTAKILDEIKAALIDSDVPMMWWLILPGRSNRIFWVKSFEERST